MTMIADHLLMAVQTVALMAVLTVALMAVLTVALMAVLTVALMAVLTVAKMMVAMIQPPLPLLPHVMVRPRQQRQPPQQQRRPAPTSLVAIHQKAGHGPAFLVMISACPTPHASGHLLA
jgi:hypothetical protein